MTPWTDCIYIRCASHESQQWVAAHTFKETHPNPSTCWQEPGVCVDLGTCVPVTITHIIKDAPITGNGEGGGAGMGGRARGDGSPSAAEEGFGESGNGVGVCASWEEVHQCREWQAGKLMWPLAGIALHAPMFKCMIAPAFIEALGDAVFEKF